MGDAESKHKQHSEPTPEELLELQARRAPETKQLLEDGAVPLQPTLTMLARILCLPLAMLTLLPNTPLAKDMLHSEKLGEVPNFAKRYTIITWSCGTECEQIAVVDTLTEAIYLAPFVAELGTQFQIDSRLLVVNPPDAIEQVYGHEPPDWVTTRYCRWKAHRFALVYEIKPPHCEHSPKPA